MTEDKNAPVLEHSHDGIQEYDNPLPAWWLWTFFLTIIFGFHYWIHFHLGAGPTQEEELAADMRAIESVQSQAPPPPSGDGDFEKLRGDAAVLSQGKEVYQAKCTVCHGNELQGLIGPNLTDEFWIHGKGAPADIATVVRTGVLDKGMPNWDSMLKAEEITAVVIFTASRIGSKPPNPKAPQGEKVAN
jgi:cytochrome c oxidase cbb3-type subunit 3